MIWNNQRIQWKGKDRFIYLSKYFFWGSNFRIVQKNIDPEANIVFEIDEDNKEVHVYNTEAIVVEDSEFESVSDAEKVSLMLYNVPLSDAKKVKSDAQIDDLIKIEVDLLALSKSSNPVVQKTPKIIESSILQAIKKLQKSIVYTKYLEKIGETVKVMFISKNTKGSMKCTNCWRRCNGSFTS